MNERICHKSKKSYDICCSKEGCIFYDLGNGDCTKDDPVPTDLDYPGYREDKFVLAWRAANEARESADE